MRQLCIILSALVALSNAYKVAIIGGGISGTFTAKYLAEYDANQEGSKRRDCLLDEIVVYDVSPPPPGFTNDEEDDNGISATDSNKDSTESTTSKLQSSSEPRPSNYQGSRVSSIKLQDGSVVELGASIIYNGNQLVVDMINGDSDRLKRIKPMSTGKEENDNKKTSGFGIYHGNKEWLLNLSSFGIYPSFIKSILQSLYILFRYNIDFFRLRSAVKTAIHSFDMIYTVLNDTEHDVTYFDTPHDIWITTGLGRLSTVSFHDFLDGLGLYRDTSLEFKKKKEDSRDSNRKEGSWFDWRRYIPGMGCMRSELVTGMTINTYNQDLNEMNGLVGLVSYVPANGGGELFSIEGGNHLLMESALWQAREIYNTSFCTSTSPSSNKPRIQRYQKTITTVVAREKYMELYAEGFELLGQFDIVILAAPLQQCRIQFLQSGLAMDASILHEMPLGGLKENLDSEDSSEDRKSATNEHGEHLFASSLPSSATTPYTSVFTTLVSNATLNATHFGLQDDEIWPRSILVSERGKAFEGITTLTILSAEQGLIKTFSSEELTLEQRTTLFGTDHIIEYVQVWGGEGGYGGATPNFGGGRNSKSLPFLIYDGAKHWGKGNSGDGPALYYVNAIESAVAAIEISAIGAKATSKLVARRLGLITPKKKVSDHDEL